MIKRPLWLKAMAKLVLDRVEHRSYAIFWDRQRPQYLDVNALVGIFFEFKLVPFLAVASLCEEISNLFVVDLREKFCTRTRASTGYNVGNEGTF